MPLLTRRGSMIQLLIDTQSGPSEQEEYTGGSRAVLAKQRSLSEDTPQLRKNTTPPGAQLGKNATPVGLLGGLPRRRSQSHLSASGSGHFITRQLSDKSADVKRVLGSIPRNRSLNRVNSFSRMGVMGTRQSGTLSPAGSGNYLTRRNVFQFRGPSYTGSTSPLPGSSPSPRRKSILSDGLTPPASPLLFGSHRPPKSPRAFRKSSNPDIHLKSPPVPPSGPQLILKCPSDHEKEKEVKQKEPPKEKPKFYFGSSSSEDDIDIHQVCFFPFY